MRMRRGVKEANETTSELVEIIEMLDLTNNQIIELERERGNTIKIRSIISIIQFYYLLHCIFRQVEVKSTRSFSRV